MSDGPALAGIRVLDLTQGVTGPYATKLFADYGADVVKIERPGSGDPARRIGPFPRDEPHLERSGIFLDLNTSKQSVTLNLKTATGQAILQRLAANVDVVFESFRPGTLERLGLGWDTLRRANPRAVLVQISNCGQDGPYRDYELDDMLAYALGGVLRVTGEGSREPAKIGLYAPLCLAGGVVASMAFGAFLGADRDGAGERVDVSILDILASSMDRGGPNLVAYQYSGALTMTRARSYRGTAMPRGIYPTSDGYVYVNARPAWWDRFCRTIGREDLIADEAWTSRIMDMAFQPEVDALFYPWLLSHTKREAMLLGQAAGIPVGALNTMEDVFSDPHLRERNFFTSIEHPETGPLEYPAPPFAMLGTPAEMRRAPLLGEHTSRVLCERLGYTPQQLAILRQRDVI